MRCAKWGSDILYDAREHAAGQIRHQRGEQGKTTGEQRNATSHKHETNADICEKNEDQREGFREESDATIGARE